MYPKCIFARRVSIEIVGAPKKYSVAHRLRDARTLCSGDGGGSAGREPEAHGALRALAALGVQWTSRWTALTSSTRSSWRRYVSLRYRRRFREKADSKIRDARAA